MKNSLGLMSELPGIPRGFPSREASLSLDLTQSHSSGCSFFSQISKDDDGGGNGGDDGGDDGDDDGDDDGNDDDDDDDGDSVPENQMTQN